MKLEDALPLFREGKKIVDPEWKDVKYVDLRGTHFTDGSFRPLGKSVETRLDVILLGDYIVLPETSGEEENEE